MSHLRSHCGRSGAIPAALCVLSGLSRRLSRRRRGGGRVNVAARKHGVFWNALFPLWVDKPMLCLKRRAWHFFFIFASLNFIKGASVISFHDFSASNLPAGVLICTSSPRSAMTRSISGTTFSRYGIYSRWTWTCRYGHPSEMMTTLMPIRYAVSTNRLAVCSHDPPVWVWRTVLPLRSSVVCTIFISGSSVTYSNGDTTQLSNSEFFIAATISSGSLHQLTCSHCGL